ncbi:hypothetical protein [Bacillus pseudomycoides]|uniref:hypothetical protein n=1 Tax=Bacillus pseudomycoides TaxID=64104 RepID=UPI0018ABE558|nr:hypothetical protein [Bacillus pseudomycoides]
MNQAVLLSTMPLYISILIFQHISRCYEEQKVTASMHGRISLPSKKKGFMSIFQFVLI